MEARDFINLYNHESCLSKTVQAPAGSVIKYTLGHSTLLLESQYTHLVMSRSQSHVSIQLVVFMKGHYMSIASNTLKGCILRSNILLKGTLTIFYVRRVLRQDEIGPDKKKKLTFEFFFIFSSDITKRRRFFLPNR